MAAARSVLILLITLAIPSCISALQVTPDSPCASFCLDSNDLDYSDPDSSNTENKDITCEDSRYQTEPAGRKFQQCVSCLQDSDFVQGAENDQFWFLYNMRYSFDYCIFGFPNATGIGSSPCTTSTACGGLETALIDDELNPQKSTQYSYCDTDGGAMLGPAFDKCLSCVRAGGEHYYLANYLVALGAGCQQRPEPGTIVGLNSTVFTKGAITIVDPTSKADADKDEAASLPMTAIVGIVVGAVVALLLVAGCVFIQCRKRRARRNDRGINPELSRRARGHRPVSSLSFRCQTHLTPKTPTFFSIEEDEGQNEKHHHTRRDGQPAHSTTPYSPSMSDAYPWDPHSATPYSSPSSFAAATVFQNPSPTSLTDKKTTDPQKGAGLPLTNITTSLPTNPAKSFSPRTFSTSPQDDYSTPTSTTSAAPLLPLRPYVPSEHGISNPALGSHAHAYAAAFSPASYSFPTSGTTASPLHSSEAGWPATIPSSDRRAPVLPQQRDVALESANRTMMATIPVVVRDLARPLPKRITSLGGGSPVESHAIQTSFPPPPPPTGPSSRRR